MTEIKNFLINTCETMGVSGFESEAAQAIQRDFSNYCDDVTIDQMGNLIGFKKGRGKGKLMLAAHMDEIGLIVTEIEDNGFVRFSAVGGYDQRTLVSQEVTIFGKEKVFGVIGMKPPHLIQADEKNKSIPIHDLAIDTGFSKEELIKKIRAGDIATVNRKITELQNGRVAGKAIDDRGGVASLYACMRNLKDFQTDFDIYYVATTQEEVGARGAATTAHEIQPDIAIVIDVDFAHTPELKEHQAGKMGKGPIIHMGPNIHPGVYQMLKKTAETHTQTHQFRASPGGHSGTDAVNVQIAGFGIATGIVSIPLKYMHTPVELVDLKDIEQTGVLLSSFIMSLNDCDWEESLCY